MAHYSKELKMNLEENITGGNGQEVCPSSLQRLCKDGSCIARMDLCPEEEMMNQETILIMIGVGMGVILFLIMLYCLQQRRNANAEQEGVGLNEDEVDHPELLMPPPAYDEAVNVNLYPPTPQRNRSLLSIEEPRTPPPNYDAALHLLAQSEENIFFNKEPEPPSPAMQHALSLEHITITRGRPMTFSSFGANSKTFRQRPPDSQT